MQFTTIIAALTLAVAASAHTCGINGALCDGKRSVGLTNKAREWIGARAVEAVNVARDVEAVEIEIEE
ncbi:hypothetical protein K504DRAFT_464662 [Pleomassaria siparia CBS 279.74]|uniref:Uncharacterized protein n=1 Tax=Pleomassaria siparia CBS 279.74 TaxID=1314801 RepID=A0A6G1KJ64_9PLEO|nr:hypothetical protein K504DRAFT_464662 [Pleomassaria siparia CBS 279.74]